jgi:flagellar basal-body rod modification protein FlgD
MAIDSIAALIAAPTGTPAAPSGTAAAARGTGTPSPAAAASGAPPAPASATSTAPSASAQASTDAAADRFLTLLVTQLRNQDPLNPLDNAQVTTQLAQLSTVTGINKLNDSFAALAAQFAAAQYLQALPLVGHDVTIAGNKMALTDGKASYGVAYAAPADHVIVKISNSAGKVVRTIDMASPQPAGVANYTWDGKADDGSACADGTYTIDVAATAAGKEVVVDTLEIARVTGVIPGERTTLLSLGSLGIIDLSQVLQIN